MSEKTMFAYAAFDPNTIKKVQLPIPEPDDYEALVENEGCVFCNATDKMIVERLFATPDYPVLFGHESFGRVVKVGKKVTKFHIGDRVICSNAIVNNYNGTYHSTWGGFSQYGIVGDLEAYLADHGSIDEENAYRSRYKANSIIPGDLPYEKACMVFPLAETASALTQVGSIEGKTVVIIGTGIMGSFFTYFAKVYGAKKVICLEKNPARLAFASALGADETYTDAADVTASLSGEGGADVVIECSGHPQALEGGLTYLKLGGIFAGYAVPFAPYVFNLQKSPRNFTYQRINPNVPIALDKVCELLRQNAVPLDLFLTHKWSFDEVPEAFEAVRRGEVFKGLVVIKE